MGFLTNVFGGVGSNIEDAIDSLRGKDKEQTDAEKGTKTETVMDIPTPPGMQAKDSSTTDQKAATETSDSDVSSDQGKLSEDSNKLEFFRYPIDIQALGDKIKHWVEIDISEIKSETLTVGEIATLVETVESLENQGKSFLEKVGAAAESAFNKNGIASAIGATAETAARQGIAAVATIGNVIGTKLTNELKGSLKTVSKDSPNNKLRAKIAIYMPDTVFFTQRNNYEDRSFDQVFGKLGQAAQIGSALTKDISADIANKPVGEIVNALIRNPGGTELIGGVAGGFLGTQVLGEGLLKGAGYAQNPQVELFFTGVERRHFQFDFKFNSRSAKETEQIQGIIKTLRKWAAPTIPSIGLGRYFTPPAIFDINFGFYDPVAGWKINDKIPKISRCALENIDVNYVGSGKYLTYEDGQPVDIEVRLSFVETDIMTRKEIEAGY